MSQQYSTVVFFKASRLPPDQRHHPFHRRAFLDDGIAALRSKFPNAVIGQARLSSLSVSVTVSNEVLQDLVSYLDNNELAECVLGGQILKAVRDDGDSRDNSED